MFDWLKKPKIVPVLNENIKIEKEMEIPDLNKEIHDYVKKEIQKLATKVDKANKRFADDLSATLESHRDRIEKLEEDFVTVIETTLPQTPVKKSKPGRKKNGN